MLRDFKTIHYGGADGYGYDIGIGFHAADTITIENGDMQGWGLYAHGVYFNRIAGGIWNLNLKAVTGKVLFLSDFLEYNKNNVTLDGCAFDELKFYADRSWYDANPANVLFNRGYFHQSIDISARASKIGRITPYNAFTRDTVLVTPLLIPGTNDMAINKGAGSIAIGQAVKLLADPALPNSYPAASMQHSNVAGWAGSGIFAGVAETAMAADVVGTVQSSGRPYVLADATGVAIAYGDDLEINATGSFVKRVTGVIRANALEAKASGSGLIVARLY